MILGDPLAPLHNALMATPAIWQWSVDPNSIWVIRLLYPFAVTFINSPQTLGNISPLFLAFLPGIFNKKIRGSLNLSETLIVLLIVTVITLLLWIMLFFTVIEIRYVLFLWIILFMPLAKIVVGTLEHIGVFFRKLMELALILTLAFIAGRIIFISVDTYSPIDKQGFYHCYDLTLCNDLESINNLASPGDRVLGLGAYRYYLRPDLLSCSSKGEEYLILERLSNQDNSAFWEEVHRQGYKFIAYEKNYAVRHLRFGITPNPDNTPDWLHLEPIHGRPGDPTVAYMIQVNNPPFKSAVGCAKTNDGAWEVQPLVRAEK